MADDVADDVFGFIGLGNMGRPMTRNVRAKGHALIVHDIAGTAARAPEGAEIAGSNAEVVRRAGVTALSLPTPQSNRAVVEEIARAGRAGTIVVDTCTIGPEAAAENARILAAADIVYLDAPVSGLVFRAEEGTLASMVAGPTAAVERARPLVEGYSRVLFHVGPEAGQGQRMKVVNNALFISALVTTSEALAFGAHGGLDMATMIEVLNASSGSNFLTTNVLPSLPFVDSDDDTQWGAEAHIIRKDLGLFVDGAAAEGTPNAAIARAYEVIEAFAEADPLQDQGRIYGFVRSRER